MPKDKTATHKRLYECMRREFLEKGFEKAWKLMDDKVIRKVIHRRKKA